MDVVMEAAATVLVVVLLPVAVGLTVSVVVLVVTTLRKYDSDKLIIAQLL
jgi:hypothetical protein